MSVRQKTSLLIQRLPLRRPRGVTLLFKTKSATRYLYYIKILTEELGVLPSELTPVERGYSLITPGANWVTGNTYCKIDNGDVFGVNKEAIGYTPYFYLNADQKPCAAQQFQSALVLPLVAPNMKAFCDANKAGFPPGSRQSPVGSALTRYSIVGLALSRDL